MRGLLILLIFVHFAGYSQENHIDIIFNSDSVITTNWIELNDILWFDEPYILIDNKNGEKIKLEAIKSYKGYDQDGNYRQLQKNELNASKDYSFTELMLSIDSTEKVQIFYNQLTFGNTNKTSRYNRIKYMINDQTIKNLNYSNIKRDFDQLNFASNKLKEANQIRLFQYFTVVLATGLFIDIAYHNFNPNEKNFMKNKDRNLLMGTCALFIVPFTLEKTKNKKLIQALRSY